MKKDLLIQEIKFVIAFLTIILFGYVWVIYYNDKFFGLDWEWGAIIGIALYAIIYLALARLYGAFKIGTYQIGEILFSQFLSLGIADFIVYAECCLLQGKYVDVRPGIVCVILQFLFNIIMVVIGKKYFMKYIRPKKTLIIYDQENPEELIAKIEKKLPHMFFQIETIAISNNNLRLKEKANQKEAIILYEIESSKRSSLLCELVKMNKTVYVTPRLDDIILQSAGNRHLIDTPLLKCGEDMLEGKVGYSSKRIWDIIIAIIVLLITLPICLLIAVAIKVEDGGPIIFKQKRVTIHSKIFEMYKFRSMIVNAEKDGIANPCKNEDPRITKVGQLIRTYRLDELPQLINVLKGNMSIVGPRPERVEHMQKYTEEIPEFSARLQVRGGLTGYAQVYGKYNTSAKDKLKLDLMYIENMSLWMDMKIMFMTIKIVFIRESTEGFEKIKVK